MDEPRRDGIVVVQKGDPRYCPKTVRHEPHSFTYEYVRASDDDGGRTIGNYWCDGIPTWPADAEIVSGDEHPSGLRDAIAGASAARAWPTSDEARNVEIQVHAWLSVASEGEIAAVREALATAAREYFDEAVVPGVMDDFERAVRRALAASRGVLLPKETT